MVVTPNLNLSLRCSIPSLFSYLVSPVTISECGIGCSSSSSLGWNKNGISELKLKCMLRNNSMDVKTSQVDDVTECFNVMEETNNNNNNNIDSPSVATLLMNFDTSFDPYASMTTPLYQTATFKQPSATDMGPYDYTRSGNPTRDVLERLVAQLDKAHRAFCFTSGMAALSAVAHLVHTGQEIVAGDDIYGGSDRLLSQVLPNTGILVKRVNTSNLDEVTAAIGPQTKLVWLESPTNPRQQICDIRG